jgi:nucleotide-binding universal stress UspA family protein
MTFQRIVVPTDGSDLASKAVSKAVSLAQHLNATVYAFSVKEPFPYNALSEIQPAPPPDYEDLQERLVQQRLNAVQDACKAAGVTCRTGSAESLNPWQAIIDFARGKEADLIVMGSHGRRGMAALLLGSETQKVLTHCHVPVLVVR